jgi:hypothetical protein
LASSTYRFSSYSYPRKLSTSPLQTLCSPDSTSTMSATEKTNCPIYLHDRYLRNENKELQLNNVICVRRRFMSFMLCSGVNIDFYSSCSVGLSFECVIVNAFRWKKVQYTESSMHKSTIYFTTRYGHATLRGFPLSKSLRMHTICF